MRRRSKPQEPRTLWERLPVEERAGTVLDHRFCETVYGPDYKKGPGRYSVHGTIDRRQRVFQSGGELKNFLLWKRRRDLGGLLSLALSVWNEITSKPVEWIELVDHELNRCYRIKVSTAAEIGEAYDEGIGPRWGVPFVAWSVTSGGREPTRPVPTGPSAPTVRHAPPMPLQGSLL